MGEPQNFLCFVTYFVNVISPMKTTANEDAKVFERIPLIQHTPMYVEGGSNS